MTLVYQHKKINDLSNLNENDKIQIKDGSGGDSGKVFFVEYSDNKVFFTYQIGYLPTPKYLVSNADFKTIQIFKLK